MIVGVSNPYRYGHINQLGKDKGFQRDREARERVEIKRVEAMSSILGIIKSLNLIWARCPEILPGWRT